jgi:hypothetical protein
MLVSTPRSRFAEHTAQSDFFRRRGRALPERVVRFRSDTFRRGPKSTCQLAIYSLQLSK